MCLISFSIPKQDKSVGNVFFKKHIDINRNKI